MKYIACLLYFVLSNLVVNAQTKEEILKKHFEKTGTLEKWIEINTVKIESIAIYGKSLLTSFTQSKTGYAKKNTFWRSESSEVNENNNLPIGLPIVVASDSAGTWNKLKSSNVERLSKYGIDFVQINMTIFLATEIKNKENVQLKPNEIINGKEYHVLDVKNDRMRRLLYLDTKTYIIHGYQSTNYKDGSKEHSITYLSDYREINGLLFPFQAEVDMMGTMVKTITKSIQINIPIDDKIFSPEKE